MRLRKQTTILVIIMIAVVVAAATVIFVFNADGGNDISETVSLETVVAETALAETGSGNADSVKAGSETEIQAASNSLVVYFSRVGNTDFPADMDAVSSASLNVRDGEFAGNNQLVAEAVHNLVGGDFVEIVTQEPYPVDYDETVEQSHGEQRNGILPGLRTEIANMADYDVIYIGFPIWATSLPMPVEGFLTQYDLSGKTIVPFCTHAGYGAGQSESRVKELCPDSNVLEMLAVDDDELDNVPQMVSEWLEKMGILGGDGDGIVSVHAARRELGLWRCILMPFAISLNFMP